MQTTQFIIMADCHWFGFVASKTFEPVCFAYEMGINTRLGFGHKLNHTFN